MYSNLYYRPEEYGFEIIDSVDIADSYAFDILLVVRDKEGNLYYVQDSGCSCPVPFENTDKEDLNPITRGNLTEFEQVCKEHKPTGWSSSLSDTVLWHGESLSLYKKVYDLI
jgi:hypothetical protein